MNLSVRERESRQSRCPWKVWSRFKMALLTSNDSIKKSSTQVLYPHAWVLVNFNFFITCVHVCYCVFCTHRGQKRFLELVPLELELQAETIHLMWVLETKLGASSREPTSLNHWAISYSLSNFLKISFTLTFLQLHVSAYLSCVLALTIDLAFWNFV